MAEPSDRPQPDALLSELKKSQRGRLKIFLGAAPGVGKTYAMLEAAQRRAKEGIDLIVGMLETHGRAETELLAEGLDILPRKQIVYRDRIFYEMDIDAILKRRPRLAIVDELAHTNVPGSRHVKRYQDVAEILGAGIDVYTTLNIQHLESLNDIIARIARIRVRETVPDSVLDEADEIELIDLPPEDLIERLNQGKVYVKDQATRAITHFFSRGNLTALRELTMRAAAERIDAEMLSYMKAHAISGPWPAREFSPCIVRVLKRHFDRIKILEFSTLKLTTALRPPLSGTPPSGAFPIVASISIWLSCIPMATAMTYSEVLAHAGRPYTIDTFIDALEAVGEAHPSFDKSSPDDGSHAATLAAALAGPGMQAPVESSIFPLMYELSAISSSGNVASNPYTLCLSLQISFNPHYIDGHCALYLSIPAQSVIDKLGLPIDIDPSKYFVVHSIPSLPIATNPLGTKIMKFTKNRLEITIFTEPNGNLDWMKFSVTTS